MPLQELPHHDDCVYWHFLEIFYTNARKLKTIPVKAAFLKYEKNIGMQPAQVKLHPGENFLLHAKFNPYILQGR